MGKLSRRVLFENEVITAKLPHLVTLEVLLVMRRMWLQREAASCSRARALERSYAGWR